LHGGDGRLLARSALPASWAGARHVESRLVSLHTALGVNAVLWIDRLLGLRNPAMFNAIAPRPHDAPAFFARCLIDTQGQTWQELDLQVLASDPEFLAVAA
jgi:twitching motility protein PilI